MGFFTGGSSAGQFTIGELMNVDQTRQQKAGGCGVDLVKVYHELQKESVLQRFRPSFLGKNMINTYYIICKFKVTSETGNVHNVYIRLLPDPQGQLYMNNSVKIYCDCGDFKYRSAYTLGKRNSVFLSDIAKTKLGPALMEPPRRQGTTLLCKHAFAALQWLVNNYQSVMS